MFDIDQHYDYYVICTVQYSLKATFTKGKMVYKDHLYLYKRQTALQRPPLQKANWSTKTDIYERQSCLCI